jgi:hypothetical protein
VYIDITSDDELFSSAAGVDGDVPHFLGCVPPQSHGRYADVTVSSFWLAPLVYVILAIVTSLE